MCDFLSQHWKELVAIIGITIGLWKYFDSRARELNWKKMEFLFNEAKYLDNDEDIIEAVKILSNENPNVTIEKIFGDNSDSDLRNKYIVGFEKLFNLLDRLSHAYFSLGTLSLEEIRNFSWYLREITKSSKLLKYCEDNGYGDVVKLSQEI